MNVLRAIDEVLNRLANICKKLGASTTSLETAIPRISQLERSFLAAPAIGSCMRKLAEDVERIRSSNAINEAVDTVAKDLELLVKVAKLQSNAYRYSILVFCSICALTSMAIGNLVGGALGFALTLIVVLLSCCIAISASLFLNTTFLALPSIPLLLAIQSAMLLPSVCGAIVMASSIASLAITIALARRSLKSFKLVMESIERIRRAVEELEKSVEEYAQASYTTIDLSSFAEVYGSMYSDIAKYIEDMKRLAQRKGN